MKTKRFTIPTFFLVGVAILAGFLYYELFSQSFCKGWICAEIDPRFVLDVPQLVLVLGLHLLPVIPVSNGRVNVIVWGHEYSHAFTMSLFGVTGIRLKWNVPLVGDPQSAIFFRRLLARFPGTHNVSSDCFLTGEQYVFVALARRYCFYRFGLYGGEVSSQILCC
ncbi:hypothetical protein HY772_06240 [Candidatus Woesearchaeota archaeon]|nr:hypothetical protein [Candidatus Woesearchaeota archaeon]